MNAQLLTRAGFIEKVMAGVYTYLPFGQRVLTKIEGIVREEMNKISDEILMPSLAPKELWQATSRLEAVDILFEARGANVSSQTLNPAEYILNPTHEELVTPLAKQFHTSYRELPRAVYQIQTKFRNEPRAKSGLLRGREFRMKDLYSFHTSEADLKDYYERVKEIYWVVFRRLGLADETVLTLASGGDFTPDFSHEFQTRCETGEDHIFFAQKAGIAYNREVTPSRVPDDPSLYGQEALAPLKEVKGVGVIGVGALAKLLNITPKKTTKTMIYATDDGQIIAAAVRGDYEINEYKLTRVLGCRAVKLAAPDIVRKVTGAEIGYAGIVDLPKEVRVLADDSLRGRRNFECGGNQTNYHLVNVNFGRDLPEPTEYYDIKLAQEGDVYPESGEAYEVFRASEIGNIFPLNTKFSEAFGYTYTDTAGAEQPVYMGCYGIGTSRIMGVLVEKFHDERGIIWPKAVAPFQVHLIELSSESQDVKETAERLYEELIQQGIEVLYDDRVAGAGEKFADADLIGNPIRLVVSAKTIQAGGIEWKEREKTNSEMIPKHEVLTKLKAYF